MPPSPTRPATPRFIRRVTRIWPTQAAPVSPRQSITSTWPAGVISIARRWGCSGLVNTATLSRSSRAGDVAQREGRADEVAAVLPERVDALHECVAQPALEE